MKGFIYSHRGVIRRINEDNGCFLRNNAGDYIMVVADGMGGHNGGEYASQITIDYIFKKFKILESNNSIRDYIFWIDNILNESNLILKSIGDKNKELRDMGTTVVIAIVKKEQTLVVNVGDSRCYKLKDNILTQISEDHTFVNMMYKQGIYTLSEIEKHPKKHVLTQALGSEEKVDPNYKIIDNSEYDAILLTTDGITDTISNDEMEKILNFSNSPYALKGLVLVQRALDQGGRDNITVGIIYKKKENL